MQYNDNIVNASARIAVMHSHVQSDTEFALKTIITRRPSYGLAPSCLRRSSRATDRGHPTDSLTNNPYHFGRYTSKRYQKKSPVSRRYRTCPSVSFSNIARTPYSSPFSNTITDDPRIHRSSVSSYSLYTFTDIIDY